MFKDSIQSSCSGIFLFKPMFPCVGFALLAFSLTAHALPVPPPPQVTAKSYVLMDANSGQIIAKDQATERSEPASLTKLMAVYVVFQALRDGTLKLDDTATVSEKAWRTGGSRTFLELNSRVTIDELLHGVIIQSGNDATVVLAERMAGTEDAFVQIMNEYALKLGMTDSHFVDASGLTSDPKHYVTARDLAILSRALIKEFPQYQQYFSEKYYTWNSSVRLTIE
jgi:D-alanyl-D-alanine carboxypeptidase (penicillin-binding protein 5/6)